MQFMVIGYDGTDKEAMDRRMKVREAHLAHGDKLRDAGNLLFAVAILDDEGKMVGSTMICEFESRSQLEDYLKEEPYMTGDVWQQVEIHNCKVGPSFAGRKV